MNQTFIRIVGTTDSGKTAQLFEEIKQFITLHGPTLLQEGNYRVLVAGLEEESFYDRHRKGRVDLSDFSSWLKERGFTLKYSVGPTLTAQKLSTLIGQSNPLGVIALDQGSDFTPYFAEAIVAQARIPTIIVEHQTRTAIDDVGSLEVIRRDLSTTP